MLFLCPNAHVMVANQSRYPNTPTAIIGSPYLDTLRTIEPIEHSEPTVAVTFHWDARLVPEMRSAFLEYRSILQDLASCTDRPFTLIGHAHPRIWEQASRWYKRVGIEPVRRLEDVIARADLLLADNSSVVPLAAACGLLVGWLNSTHYRRDIHHGFRFWDWVPNIPTADTPTDLPATILSALTDTPTAITARAHMIHDAFGVVDGHAAQRAVEAILRL